MNRFFPQIIVHSRTIIDIIPKLSIRWYRNFYSICNQLDACYIPAKCCYNAFEVLINFVLKLVNLFAR
jgi:hypothetical protein